LAAPQSGRAAAVNEIAATSSQHAGSGHDDNASVRDAASVLLQNLAPQERAAIVLKDVFDMSLERASSELRSAQSKRHCIAGARACRRPHRRVRNRA
jgi:DNA-directed RNA polymerase specialized sigma24 family protein